MKGTFIFQQENGFNTEKVTPEDGNRLSKVLFVDRFSCNVCSALSEHDGYLDLFHVCDEDVRIWDLDWIKKLLI